MVTFTEEIINGKFFCAMLNAPTTFSCYVIVILKSWFSWKYENEISQFIDKLHFTFLVNKIFLLFLPIKCQCCPHIETSQLICTANQFTGFYMRAILTFNGLNIFHFLLYRRFEFERCFVQENFI